MDDHSGEQAELEVDKIIISKPRKSNGSYICPVAYNTKADKLMYGFKNATLVKCKPLQQRDETMVFLKCKHAIDFICDLNALVIETIKDKSRIWFNNEMNIELIDDYFTNTLVYDKKYGDMIRLKCIGAESMIESYLGKKVDVEITFEHIRFFKQKFVIECTIESMKGACPEEFGTWSINSDAEEETDAVEDQPSPSCEDVRIIVDETVALAARYLDHLRGQHDELAAKIAAVEEKKEELLSTFDIHKIISICEDLESMCE